jgi:hypothetical protein
MINFKELNRHTSMRKISRERKFNEDPFPLTIESEVFSRAKTNHAIGSEVGKTSSAVLTRTGMTSIVFERVSVISPIGNFANSTFAIGEFRGEVRQLAKLILNFANIID